LLEIDFVSKNAWLTSSLSNAVVIIAFKDISVANPLRQESVGEPPILMDFEGWNGLVLEVMPTSIPLARLVVLLLGVDL